MSSISVISRPTYVLSATMDPIYMPAKCAARFAVSTAASRKAELRCTCLSREAAATIAESLRGDGWDVQCTVWYADGTHGSECL